MKILSFILLFACIGKLSAQFEGDDFKHASLAYVVSSISTGANLLEHNPDLCLVPASTLKLLTTATAIEQLGSTRQISTKVFIRGMVDPNGNLRGDIIIKGAGDPALGSKYGHSQHFISEWVIAVKKAGIKSIEGNIIADVSDFHPEAIPTRWIWEDIGNYYGSAAYALNGYDNLYNVYFNAAKIGQQASVNRVEPANKKLSFKVVALGSSNSRDSAYIFGDPANYSKTIRGSIPANKMDFNIKGAMPDPPLFLAEHFYTALQSSGVNISGSAKTSTKYIACDILIAETLSPTVQELATTVNFESNNLFAEALLRQLNPELDYQRLCGSVKNFWEQKGVDCSGLIMCDGSGLAPANGITPDILKNILVYMQSKSVHGKEFMASIPQAGREGTVKYFNISDKNVVVRMKSGSMDAVRCYAGYIEKNNELYAFALLMNSFTCSQKEAVVAAENWLNNIIDEL